MSSPRFYVRTHGDFPDERRFPQSDAGDEYVKSSFPSTAFFPGLRGVTDVTVRFGDVSGEHAIRGGISLSLGTRDPRRGDMTVTKIEA